MTSLTEVYEGDGTGASSRRRVYAGTALILVGAVLAVSALLVATTDLFGALASGQFEARTLAGILGGLAVPTALVGVFVGLPAGRAVQAAAAISASLCILGVALFQFAYPEHWAGYGRDLTLFVSVVYALGLFTAVWALFTAVVNFTTRNDPGGMLEMNVTRRGQTKVVEVDDSGGFGSIGFLGSDPDGDVETQTNRSAAESTDGDGGLESSSPAESRSSPAAESDRSSAAGSGPASATEGLVGGAATSDGGASTSDVRSPLDDPGDGRDAEIVDAPSPEPTDRYCGNCGHFEYVRDSGGMTPYCGFHDEAMDDMDACEEWAPNRD